MNGSYETGLLAEPLLVEAIALDPRFAAAHALLADICIIRFLYTGDRDFLEKGLAAARRAMDIDPEDPWSNYALGFVYAYRCSFTEAGFYLNRAIGLNENDVYFVAIYALWLNYCGRGDEAVETIQEALRRDPYGHEWFWDIQGIIFATQGMHRESVDAFRRMSTLPPWSRCYMAASLAKLGEPSEVRAILAPLWTTKQATSAAELLEQRMPHADPGALRRLTDVLRSMAADLP
jgi:tetratricopeptide (TPR) repeat protein